MSERESRASGAAGPAGGTEVGPVGRDAERGSRTVRLFGAAAEAVKGRGDRDGARRPQTESQRRRRRKEVEEDEEDDRFTSNEIKTSRYNVLTFLPQSLFEQFRRIANLYFLVLGLIMVVGEYTSFFESAVEAYSVLTPLAIVLSFSMAKEAYEDYGRHKQDKEVNRRITHRLAMPVRHGSTLAGASAGETGNGLFGESRSAADRAGGILVEDVEWRHVAVGDVLLVRGDEEAPADMVLLAASERGQNSCAHDGIAYVETASIDGETNLKVRVPVSWGLVGADPQPPLVEIESTGGRDNHREYLYNLSSLAGVIKGEKPSKSIHTFTGVVNLDGMQQPRPLSEKHLILRGSIMRCTNYAVGLVLYTGKQTKIALNARHPPSKLSNIDRVVNHLLKLVLSAMLLTCVLSSIFNAVWREDNEDAEYLCLKSSDKDNACKNGDTKGPLMVFTFATLYNNFVCISMYITLEVVYYIQAYLISQDKDMYDEETDTRAEARTSNLTCDLGQVQYVFTDKTGTLTRNVMTLRRCSVGGIVYGAPMGMSSEDVPETMDVGSSTHRSMSRSNSGVFAAATATTAAAAAGSATSTEASPKPGSSFSGVIDPMGGENGPRTSASFSAAVPSDVMAMSVGGTPVTRHVSHDRPRGTGRRELSTTEMNHSERSFHSSTGMYRPVSMASDGGGPGGGSVRELVSGNSVYQTGEIEIKDLQAAHNSAVGPPLAPQQLYREALASSSHAPANFYWLPLRAMDISQVIATIIAHCDPPMANEVPSSSLPEASRTTITNGAEESKNGGSAVSSGDGDGDGDGIGEGVGGTTSTGLVERGSHGLSELISASAALQALLVARNVMGGSSSGMGSAHNSHLDLRGSGLADDLASSARRGSGVLSSGSAGGSSGADTLNNAGSRGLRLSGSAHPSNAGTQFHSGGGIVGVYGDGGGMDGGPMDGSDGRHGVQEGSGYEGDGDMFGGGMTHLSPAQAALIAAAGTSQHAPSLAPHGQGAIGLGVLATGTVAMASTGRAGTDAMGLGAGSESIRADAMGSISETLNMGNLGPADGHEYGSPNRQPRYRPDYVDEDAEDEMDEQYNDPQSFPHAPVGDVYGGALQRQATQEGIQSMAGGSADAFDVAGAPRRSADATEGVGGVGGPIAANGTVGGASDVGDDATAATTPAGAASHRDSSDAGSALASSFQQRGSVGGNAMMDRLLRQASAQLLGDAEYQLFSSLIMAVCNTVLITPPEDYRSSVGAGSAVFDKIDDSMRATYAVTAMDLAACIQAESPDEAALVTGAAQAAGVVLANRTPSNVTVFIGAEHVTFEVLASNEFDSFRKCMSVLLRFPSGQILLLAKGADSSMIPKSTRDGVCLATEHHVRTFAAEGLRTLVFAMRVVSEEELGDWLPRYFEATSAVQHREEQMRAVAQEIECDLQIVGCVGIEDELQEGVPATISLMRHAGIHIWMLTGDKAETAESIGHSCALLPANADIERITDVHSEDDLHRKLMDLLTVLSARDWNEVIDPDARHDIDFNFNFEGPDALKRGWKRLRDWGRSVAKRHSSSARNTESSEQLNGDLEESLLSGGADGGEAASLSGGRGRGRGREERKSNVGMRDSGASPYGDSDTDDVGSEVEVQSELRDNLTAMDRFEMREQGMSEEDLAAGDNMNMLGEPAGRDSEEERHNRLALIIDGPALTMAIKSPTLEPLLADVVTRLHIVIACRVSPLQKATLVRMIKKKLGTVSSTAMADALGPRTVQPAVRSRPQAGNADDSGAENQGGHADNGALGMNGSVNGNGNPGGAAGSGSASGVLLQQQENLQGSISHSDASGPTHADRSSANATSTRNGAGSNSSKSDLFGTNGSQRPVTLAIGDGANDVGMLHEAQIGVGISGREGRHAANSSDFAFAQFRFLARLLLVHGRLDYMRTSKVVLYSFYKNLVLVSVLFYYAYYNGWSGTALYESLIYGGYNFFLGLPIIAIGIFDQDVPAFFALRHPSLAFASGRRHEMLNFTLLFRWGVTAFMLGAIIFGLGMRFASHAEQLGDLGTQVPGTTKGHDSGLYMVGFIVYTSLVFSMQYKVAAMTFTWTKWNVLAWVLSFMGFFLFVYVYSLFHQVYDWFNVPQLIWQEPPYWLAVLLIPTVVIMVDFLLTCLFELLTPTSNDRLRQLWVRQREHLIPTPWQVAASAGSWTATKLGGVFGVVGPGGGEAMDDGTVGDDYVAFEEARDLQRQQQQEQLLHQQRQLSHAAGSSRSGSGPGGRIMSSDLTSEEREAKARASDGDYLAPVAPTSHAASADAAAMASPGGGMGVGAAAVDMTEL